MPDHPSLDLDLAHAGRRAASVASALLLATLLACGGGEGGDSGTEGDTASQASGTAGSPLSGAAGSTMAELRSVQERLTAIQDSALQDPELSARRDEIDDLIQETMEEISPGAADRVERFDSLRARFETARSEGDTAVLRGMMGELQKLQRALQQTRAQAIEEENVAAALDSFRNRLLAKMEEIDPATDSLMDVADSLRQDLRSSMQGHPGMGGGAPSDTAE